MKNKKLLTKLQKVTYSMFFNANCKNIKLFIRKSHWGGRVESWCATDDDMIKYANDCPHNSDWLDENGLAEFKTIDEAVDYFAHDYSDYKYMNIDDIIDYLERQIKEGNIYSPYSTAIQKWLCEVAI